MSSEKTRKSDRFQILTAVLFMTLFAAVLLLTVVPKGSVANFVCSYTRNYDGFAWLCPDLSFSASEGPSQLVTSRINYACVDDQGLKISVSFGQPLTGAANIQVFSMGPDFFPSEQGMTDTYEVTRAITAAVDSLDLIIPVESMSVGEPIFGNIMVSEQRISAHVAYFINVSDCAIPGTPASPQTPISAPIIRSASCSSRSQLMIAFEFERPVVGQYQLFVADTPYQLTSAVSQPAILFFSGQPPPGGPVVIKLISATDEVTVFEESYTPPACGAT